MTIKPETFGYIFIPLMFVGIVWAFSSCTIRVHQSQDRKEMYLECLKQTETKDKCIKLVTDKEK